MVAARAGRRSGGQECEKRFAAGFLEPLERSVRLAHVWQPAQKAPAYLPGMDEILDCGRAIGRTVGVEMAQDEVHAAGIEQGVVPGKEQVVGAILVAHQVQGYARTFACV